MNNIPTDEIASLLRRLADTLSPLPTPKKPELAPPGPPKTPLQQARELLETVPQRKVDAGLAMYKAHLSRAQVRHALGLTFDEVQALEVVSRAPQQKQAKSRPGSRKSEAIAMYKAGKTVDEVTSALGIKSSSALRYATYAGISMKRPVAETVRGKLFSHFDAGGDVESAVKKLGASRGTAYAYLSQWRFVQRQAKKAEAGK